MSREEVDSGACRMAKEDTETNLSDIFTKKLPQPKRELLLPIFSYLIGEPTVSEFIGNTEGIEWHTGDLHMFKRKQKQLYLVREYQIMNV